MFENDSLAAEELQTRTSKILGGGVSERLFLDEFVIPYNLPYSKGWWISLCEGTEEVLFFVVKNELSPFDLDIYRLLTNRGFKVFQIVCLSDHYEISCGGRFVTVEEFLRMRGIEPKETMPRRRNAGEILKDVYNIIEIWGCLRKRQEAYE